MKKGICFVSIILVVLLSSCSKYSVKEEIDRTSRVDVKKAGILLRISRKAMLRYDVHYDTLQKWLQGYTQNVELELINGKSDYYAYFSNEQDRFYQLSMNNAFLKYKSLGVINSYLYRYKNDLSALMKAKNLDVLIIYEVYGIASVGMQFLDFDSMAVIIDKNLKVVYLDHQHDRFNSNDYSIDLLKEQLLNKMNDRMLEFLIDLDYIED
ncbi:MAG: hypothetical protein ACOCWZ_02535 [Spirochaetota bacterium]